MSDSPRPRGYRPAVLALRRLILLHARVAALIVAMALAVKLLVPGGYMLAVDQGRVTITLCSGVQPAAAAMPMAHGAAMDHGDHRRPADHAKPDMPCGFASLMAQGTAPVDALLLAIAIGFIIAAGLRSAPAWPVLRRPFLRPPLRGPPAIL